MPERGDELAAARGEQVPGEIDEQLDEHHRALLRVFANDHVLHARRSPPQDVHQLHNHVEFVRRRPRHLLDHLRWLLQLRIVHDGHPNGGAVRAQKRVSLCALA
eukprot:541435-Rhodomonas_salina.2